jgi:hypothetical protein
MLSDAERHKLDRAIADVADIIAVHRISFKAKRQLTANTAATLRQSFKPSGILPRHARA